MCVGVWVCLLLFKDLNPQVRTARSQGKAVWKVHVVDHVSDGRKAGGMGELPCWCGGVGVGELSRMWDGLCVCTQRKRVCLEPLSVPDGSGARVVRP